MYHIRNQHTDPNNVKSILKNPFADMAIGSCIICKENSRTCKYSFR